MQYTTLFLAACMGLATTISALKYPFSEVPQCGKTCIKEAIASSQTSNTSACIPAHPACLCSEFSFGPNWEVINKCVQKKCTSEAKKGVVLDYFSESCVNYLIAYMNGTDAPVASATLSKPTTMPTAPIVTTHPSSKHNMTITNSPKRSAAAAIDARQPNIISDVASVASEVTSAVESVATEAASAVRSGAAAASSAADDNAGVRKQAAVGVAALFAAGVGLVVVGGI